MKVAAVQMTSKPDVAANLAEADRLVAEAAAEGAKLVVLPENFSFMGAKDSDRSVAREPFGNGPAQAFLVETAARHRVWLVGGTIPILDGATARATQRSLLVGPDGRVVDYYDKIHLFDVDVPGKVESYAESASTVPGGRVVAAQTDVGRVGMTVCYDIRFPALFHRLSVLGTDILVVPAAFTVPTGEVHWLPLLKARAIESLVYVVAAGQWGEHDGGRKTYGHSLVIGPWGDVLAERASGAGVVCVDLDMERLIDLRERFPTVKHRREL